MCVIFLQFDPCHYNLDGNYARDPISDGIELRREIHSGGISAMIKELT